MGSPDITPVFHLAETVVHPPLVVHVLPEPKSDAELDILIAEKNHTDGVDGWGLWKETTDHSLT